MSEKETRVRAITRIYYTNPNVQKALFEFSKSREVVPRYFEGFGKRPDTIQYPGDIFGMVSKGATSFHASEEIWDQPLEINSDMSTEELSDIRSGWDLLLDIDSPYLDYSKIAARLIIEELEKHKIKSYAIKFSGSKGFHIIVPSKAFPETFNGIESKKMFPEWPRAITQFLMNSIKPKYNKEVAEMGVNFEAVHQRTNLSKEDILEIKCPSCGKDAKKTNLVHFKCNRCDTPYARPNFKLTKRQLKCTEISCPGYFEVIKEEDYFFCENCKTKLKIDIGTDFWKTSRFRSSTTTTARSQIDSGTSEEFKEELSASKLGALDLVLVSSRHLFRMPYSLHEKTALASVVLTKDQISSFLPKDANPLKVKVRSFYPNASPGEAEGLLAEALEWRRLQDNEEEIIQKKKYSDYTPTDFSGVTEDMFPKPIKKLLKGLQEGRKRGLFILITFLKSLNYSPAQINEMIIEWNKKNKPPLKEGYVKSQIDWHIKQKKKILPPNYSNESFYKDLNLLDSLPNAKNPISEVARKMFRD